MKKLVISLMSFVAMVVVMSISCSCDNVSKKPGSFSSNDRQTITENTEEKPDETNEVIIFLNNLYKDLEVHPSEYQDINNSRLVNYMAKNAMEKLLVESDYEDGFSFYDTEFFTDGQVLGGQHGDYNGAVSREITCDKDNWYNILTKFKDNIPSPTLIKVKVEKNSNKYMITDVKLNE